jgi:hypothetical protein
MARSQLHGTRLQTLWIQRSTAEVPEELGFQVDTTVRAMTEFAPLLRG